MDKKTCTIAECRKGYNLNYEACECRDEKADERSDFRKNNWTNEQKKRDEQSQKAEREMKTRESAE